MVDDKTIEPKFGIQAPVVLPTSTNDFYNTRFQEAYKIKKHLTVAPTFIPNNFFDQIQFYDDGTHQRVYYYINGAWKYTTL